MAYATYDTSLISKCEGWIEGRLKSGIEYLAMSDVYLFPGLADYDGSLGNAMEEFIAIGRRPFVTLGWKSSSDMPIIDEDSSDRESRYMLHVCTDNPRAAGARVGEAYADNQVGTNYFVEQIIALFHDTAPAMTSGLLTLTTDRCYVGPVRTVFAPKGISIVEIELVIREVPSA